MLKTLHFRVKQTSKKMVMIPLHHGIDVLKHLAKVSVVSSPSPLKVLVLWLSATKSQWRCRFHAPQQTPVGVLHVKRRPRQPLHKCPQILDTSSSSSHDDDIDTQGIRKCNIWSNRKLCTSLVRACLKAWFLKGATAWLRHGAYLATLHLYLRWQGQYVLINLGILFSL